MSTQVAMIPYANMAPYRQLGPPDGCHFVSLVPSASVSALSDNTVVAAAVPVGGLQRLGDAVEPVGCFGIAAKGPSMSVLLFSRLPFSKLHNPRILRVTSETATSVRLLYLLLAQAHGVDWLPRLASQEDRPDAELLIGDRALIKGAAKRIKDEYPHIVDLSQRWFEECGLPFVFARWMVRKDAPDSIKLSISRWLEQFKKKESLLVDKAILETARSLGIEPDLARRYFRVIRRSLDEEDIRGQRRFAEKIHELGRDPRFQQAE